MRVGLQTPYFKWDGSPENIAEKLAEIAHTVDENGFYSMWVMDHFFQLPSMGRDAHDPMLEAYTALGFLAAHTKHVKLGVLVNGVIYREPALLVKAHTTLDVLSGGRTYFGIGAGWYEREAVGLGFPFSTFTERFERLEEALQITKQMWADDTSEFKGKYYNPKEPITSPQPLTKPHPPIMVGGEGEQKTLRMVARYADASNFFGRSGGEHVRRKLDILKKHCEELGRDYSEIEKTALTVNGRTPKETISHLTELAAAGIEHVMLVVPGMHEIEPLKVIGREVIPAVKDL